MDTVQCVYSLVLRNRTPNIKPGDTVEIEIFLSGYGVPTNNKLDIKWSSPYMVKADNPGTLTGCIKVGQDNVTGKLTPLAGKEYLDTTNVQAIGVTGVLNKGYFLPNPSDTSTPEFGIKPVVSEFMWGSNPPLLLKLNTAKNVPSGDYDITFTFTYEYEQNNIHQDSKSTPFHISSSFELKQERFTIIGIVIALLSLLVTMVFSILTYIVTKGKP